MFYPQVIKTFWGRGLPVVDCTYQFNIKLEIGYRIEFLIKFSIENKLKLSSFPFDSKGLS